MLSGFQEGYCCEREERYGQPEKVFRIVRELNPIFFKAKSDHDLMVATYKNVKFVSTLKVARADNSATKETSPQKKDVITSKSQVTQAEVTHEKPENTHNCASRRSVSERADKQSGRNNSCRGGKQCK
jgi:hypothetical protein